MRHSASDCICARLVDPSGTIGSEVKAERMDKEADSEVERSTARLRVLAQISRSFALVATDAARLIEAVARTTADLVGDGCLVTLIEDDRETLVNAANAHRDPSLEIDYRAYLASIGIAKTTSDAIAAQVARTGEPILVNEIDPAEMVARTEGRLKALVGRLNVHSYAVVPIRARDVLIGTLSLVRSRAGVGYSHEDVVMLQDIADRAGLAIENARLYAELEDRVRARTVELQLMNEQLGMLNDDLKAFNHSVAHDLRAPLRAIDGFSRIVVEEYGSMLPSAGLGYLERVRGATQRMSALIDDLLALFSVTRSALIREAVDVSELASAIIMRLREAEPSRVVDVSIAPGLTVLADPRLVEIALTNLLSNAWKFTSKTVDARIQVGAHTDLEPVALYVQDNGVGFASSQAELLFNVLTRLHANDFTGTGIGLSTVQRVVKRHGGKIWAVGEVNRGATFWFTLS